jgi:hypothetical protein
MSAMGRRTWSCAQSLCVARGTCVSPRTGPLWTGPRKISDLLEVRYPEAVRVRLGCAHRKTHGMGSLSEAGAPAPARRLAARLESHSPHQPGRWLNMAEIERSALPLQMPASTDSRSRATHTGNAAVGTEAQRNPKRRGLAVFDPGCSHETPTPLPTKAKLTRY